MRTRPESYDANDRGSDASGGPDSRFRSGGRIPEAPESYDQGAMENTQSLRLPPLNQPPTGQTPRVELPQETPPMAMPEDSPMAMPGTNYDRPSSATGLGVFGQGSSGQDAPTPPMAAPPSMPGSDVPSLMTPGSDMPGPGLPPTPPSEATEAFSWDSQPPTPPSDALSANPPSINGFDAAPSAEVPSWRSPQGTQSNGRPDVPGAVQPDLPPAPQYGASPADAPLTGAPSDAYQWAAPPQTEPELAPAPWAADEPAEAPWAATQLPEGQGYSPEPAASSTFDDELGLSAPSPERDRDRQTYDSPAAAVAAARRPTRPVAPPAPGAEDFGKRNSRRKGFSGDPSAEDAPITTGGLPRSMQDTEIKLSGRRRKPKPKEPNKPLLVGAVLLALLLVGGGAYLFNQRDSTDAGDDVASPSVSDDATESDSTTEASESEDSQAGAQEDAATGDSTDGELTDGDSTDGDSASGDADTAPAVDSPTFVFEDASAGPLDADTSYEVQLLGVSPEADLWVVVNGERQAQGPSQATLPKLRFSEGRYSVAIDIVSPDGSTTTSNAVETYVLGGTPEASFRSNVSSVNTETEGWDEAIQRFDKFEAAGLEDLKLTPSDPYPSLKPGFWNIYVEGFEDREAATAHCEQFELEVPLECYPSDFDPTAPAADE